MLTIQQTAKKPQIAVLYHQYGFVTLETDVKDTHILNYKEVTTFLEQETSEEVSFLLVVKERFKWNGKWHEQVHEGQFSINKSLVTAKEYGFCFPESFVSSHPFMSDNCPTASTKHFLIPVLKNGEKINLGVLKLFEWKNMSGSI